LIGLAFDDEQRSFSAKCLFPHIDHAHVLEGLFFSEAQVYEPVADEVIHRHSLSPRIWARMAMIPHAVSFSVRA
jgi:hypothetical protein